MQTITVRSFLEFLHSGSTHFREIVTGISTVTVNNRLHACHDGLRLVPYYRNPGVRFAHHGIVAYYAVHVVVVMLHGNWYQSTKPWLQCNSCSGVGCWRQPMIAAWLPAQKVERPGFNTDLGTLVLR